MSNKLLNVLFLCESNSSLSVFGEAVLTRLGRGKFQAFSAGNSPKSQIDPMTVYELENNNYDPTGLAINDWNDYAGPDAPVMDFVIALSNKVPLDKHPEWPGQPLVTTWHIADPINAGGDDLQRKRAFVKALSELDSRISIFVNLPIDSLDRLKLQQRLNEIGA